MDNLLAGMSDEDQDRHLFLDLHQELGKGKTIEEEVRVRIVKDGHYD